jgi:hypothetical protein
MESFKTGNIRVIKYMLKLENFESGKKIAYFSLILSFFLIIFSPRVLSGDSSFYIYKAVMNEDLVHPHHLAYSLVLRCGIVLGKSIGLEESPYLVLRATMILFSWLGLWATYRFLRFLSLQRITAALGTLLVSVSGLYWQFSTQIESYIPAYSILTLSACLVLAAGRDLARKKILTGLTGKPYSILFSPSLRLVASAVLLASASAMHQACALAAPAFGLLLFIVMKGKNPIPTSNRIITSVCFCFLAGLLSLGMYLIGWIYSSPEETFSTWLTSYAHWRGMPWGLWSNFSPNGLRQLRLSWLGSWFNITPFKFASPLPGVYATPAIYCLLSGLCLSIFLVVCSLRRVAISIHIWWILLWIIPMEIFTLWWTPFLKNFQIFSLLPQITILTLGSEMLVQKLKQGKGISPKIRSLPVICLAFLCFAVFGVNVKYLVLPGLKNRLAPEEDLLLVRPFLKKGDLCVMEWPCNNLMKSLLSFHNVYRIEDMMEPARFPDWKGNPEEAKKVIAVHRSSIFLSKIALNRTGKTYEDVWSKFLNNLYMAAGGRNRIHGTFVPSEDSLLLVIFGIDPDLPLPGREVLMKIAEYSETAPPETPREMKEIIINKFLSGE